jgi:ElaB/YqjD/DUF883 family membrane-anchored ribosome-binding protein
MNSNPSSGSTSISSSAFGSQGAESENAGQGGSREDLNRLRRDVASLTEKVGRLASQAGGEAMKAARSMSETVASQVGDAAGGVAEAGSELASSAREHAKTLASELEGMARRNPLGTIAGALVLGVIIGMMTRGRS